MFDLRMRFTGLVVFVPNLNAGSRVRTCALVVDARRNDRRSLDDRPLKPHQATLKISVLTGMEDGKEVWGLLREEALARHRLFLDIDDQGEVNNPHVANFADPGEVCPEPTDGRPGWLLHLSRVFDEFTFDPRLFRAVPPGDSVLAQVLLSHGTLRMNQHTSVVWQYQNLLAPNAYRQAFAHTVDSQYGRLQTALLRIGSFAGEHPFGIDLAQLASGRPMLVEISNVCENCPGDPDRPIPDRDTKWYFELMPDQLRAKVRGRLRPGVELPIPVPDGPCGAAGPGSTNCVPARGPAQEYTFTELDGPEAAARE